MVRHELVVRGVVRQEERHRDVRHERRVHHPVDPKQRVAQHVGPVHADVRRVPVLVKRDLVRRPHRGVQQAHPNEHVPPEHEVTARVEQVRRPGLQPQRRRISRVQVIVIPHPSRPRRPVDGVARHHREGLQLGRRVHRRVGRRAGDVSIALWRFTRRLGLRMERVAGIDRVRAKRFSNGRRARAAAARARTRPLVAPLIRVVLVDA
mmetsp:Transcript_5609/g.23097  ORF Transcript_5609/g.23097 Transcript_5609/m.23097 type:complete len:207 (-) Transcript_5609:632-1252(-)